MSQPSQFIQCFIRINLSSTYKWFLRTFIVVAILIVLFAAEGDNFIIPKRCKALDGGEPVPVAVLHWCPGTQLGAPYLKQCLTESGLVDEELSPKEEAERAAYAPLACKILTYALHSDVL